MSEEQKQNDVRGQAREWRRSAASLFKWTVLTVVGIPLVWFTFCEARKGYWDWRVTQMCEKVGGVRIFEKVFLSESEARLLPKNNGQITVPVKGAALSDAPFFSEGITTRIREWNPEVWRRESVVKRRSDRKVLAELVSFTRRGGDGIPITHPSHFSCPTPEQIAVEVSNIFVVKEGSK